MANSPVARGTAAEVMDGIGSRCTPVPASLDPALSRLLHRGLGPILLDVHLHVHITVSLVVLVSVLKPGALIEMDSSFLLLIRF